MSKFTGGTQLLVSSLWCHLLSASASILDSSLRTRLQPEEDFTCAASSLLFHSPSSLSGISATSNTFTNTMLYTPEQMLLDTLPQPRKHSWFGSYSSPSSLTSAMHISCALLQLTAKLWMALNQKNLRCPASECHHSERTKKTEWVIFWFLSPSSICASALQNWQWLCVGCSHIDIFRIYFRFTPRELIIII